MKSFTSFRPLTALVATLALGTFAAVALAGPGPQYWTKSPSTPPAKSTSAAACGGCADSIQWKLSDRGPSGKGVAGASVASRTHGCTSCSGAIVSTPGHTADTMTRAAGCGTMVCCK